MFPAPPCTSTTVVSLCWRGITRSPFRFGASGGEYTTVLRVTRAGLVVLEPGAGAAVTVGSVVLPGVVSRGVVSRGVVSGAVVAPGTAGGTVIAGGGPVVGGGCGVGGTGIVGAAAVVGATRGAVVVLVRRRSDRSDESLPQPARTSAVPSETVTQPRSVTREVCPTGSRERRQEKTSGDVALLDRVADVQRPAFEDLGS